MEPERRIARRDGALTPRDSLGMDLQAVVRGREDVIQPEREVADARADVEHAMVRREAVTQDLGARRRARVREGRRIGRAVVADAQVRRGQERVAARRPQAIDYCQAAMEGAPNAPGDAP